MINTRKTTVEAGETPAKITVSMIDQDLKDGVAKAEMAIKYNIKPWEVDEMFKHPLLKGRRPSRKKALSFSFVDDMTTENEEYEDPNQITLEAAIDEAIETVEGVKSQMQETQEAILDMLSPTEYETPEETLLKAAVDTPEITGIPNGDNMSDTDDEELDVPKFIDDTLKAAENQEEEIEMDDDTFEL